LLLLLLLTPLGLRLSLRLVFLVAEANHLLVLLSTSHLVLESLVGGHGGGCCSSWWQEARVVMLIRHRLLPWHHELRRRR
jgi:hypothetical protein